VNDASLPGFDQPDLLASLEAMDDTTLDALGFGVIGFRPDTVVCRYNAYESQAAGLSPSRVLGLPLFSVVAQCMNNFLVAQRFDDAAEAGQSLDASIDFVLTLRMKPTPVKLRLLAAPSVEQRYVLILRR
jgi:photoactive yellow protein